MDKLIENILANKNIPSPPGVAVRLLELVDQPDVDAAEITKVIGADPKLSAKLIDYCNSPLMRRSREIGSLQQAVVVLGMRSVRMLALSFSLMQTDKSGQSTFDYNAFWNRSLVMALAAKTLSRHLDRSQDEDFLLGLVMNIGLIGLSSTYPTEFEKVCSQSNDSQNPALELQVAEFGVNHYQVGGHLLGKWKFPDRMVKFVEEFNPESEETDQSTDLFLIANEMVSLLFEENLQESEIEETKKDTQQRLDIGADDFDTIFDAFLAEWKEYASLLNFNCSSANSIQDLSEQARDCILRMTFEMASEMEDINEEKRKIEAEALVDSLTTLRNRRAFDSEASAALDQCRNNTEPFGLVVLDIDHFKSVNDTYGHAIGDDVLKAVGGCLKENIRSYDNVYRFGGEEFVVLLPGCDQALTTKISERFRVAVEKLSVPVEDSSISVTVSLGVAWLDPTATKPIQEMFTDADKLLYMAKKGGRNRCIFDFEFENTGSTTTEPPRLCP